MMDEKGWDVLVTWCIEDYSSRPMKTGEELESPVFTVEALDNSKWNLSVYPGGWKEDDKERFHCFLYKSNDHTSETDKKFTYEFQVSTARKKIEQSDQHSSVFENGEGKGPIFQFKREEVMTELKECSFDHLFICCSFRRTRDSKKLALKKKLRTRILSQKCSFEWKVMSPKHPQNVRGKSYFSLGNQFYQMSLAIPHEDVVITVRKLQKNISNKMIIGKIALMDVHESEVLSKRDTFIFDAELEKAVWEFPSLLTKMQLIENMTEYVKDGEIMLLCEFSLFKGVESKVVSESNFHIFDNLLTLSDDFRNFLVDKTNFDVKFLVENNVELHAHRSVLAVRSPVFCAMFDRDMNENRTGVVKIEDVDSKTMEFFLLFLYTGVLDNLDSESATKLLLLADKYEIPTLKETCADFLMSSLTVDNVCEILSIADKVRHELLKNTCLDYVSHHVTEILSAPEFSKWVKDNIELSIEITLYSVKTVDKS